MNIFSKIANWYVSIFQVWMREIKLIFHDEGVLICVFGVCVIYPVFYALIYNVEVARDIRVVIVDDSRSPLSRQFVRELDATPDVCVLDYASNMQDARRMMEQKDVYGIVYFPRDFATNVTNGLQGHVSVYCDMSVMLRYKAILTAMTNVQTDICGKIQGAKISTLGYQLYNKGSIVESHGVNLGNTSSGIASAVLPCVLVIVIQQSMILAMCMLRGGERERRIRNRGLDPFSTGAGVGATIIGKTLAFWVIYSVMVVYVLFFVQVFFDFPQNGNVLGLIVFLLPFLLAVSCFAQTLQIFVNDREATFLVIAFTSVLFVFLSGVSWPRYLMSPFWTAMGNAIPSTWACNGYILMQSDGASLFQVKDSFLMLWVLAAFWFVIAYLTNKFVIEPRYRRMRLYAEIDPDALVKEECRRNAVDYPNW